jgi:tetraacyldisaccharide 4'-kinase
MDLARNFTLHPALYPASFLYGLGVRLRNQLFDWGWLKSTSFQVPVICVGNLSAGGTGKTPHIEYLIRTLMGRYRVAVISRGYKRKTKGFLLATSESTSSDIGDEPYQIKFKYPQVTVAVDADRCRAINKLLALPKTERPEVILLDDALQHRYVSPSLTILLTDSNRMYCFDKLLPAGRLREPIVGANRASVVIVTKCDTAINPMDCRVVEVNLDLYPYQSLYFTAIRYAQVTPLFNQQASYSLSDAKHRSSYLLVTGIANPTPLIAEVNRYAKAVEVLNFSDHYMFQKKDFNQIAESLKKMAAADKRILVTEKDAARLISNPHLPEELKPFIYYIPIEINFLTNKQTDFERMILNHVAQFNKNRS